MERDPSGQLAWLVTELETAESAGERVWLMGHMPLGEISLAMHFFRVLIHVLTRVSC